MLKWLKDSTEHSVGTPYLPANLLFVFFVQQRRTTFSNRAPLIPITSSSPMERNQIDLVDMSGFPLSTSPDGIVHRYVLSIIDVFSRYLILRPLERKTSSAVAAHLLQVYCDLGVPKRIQCDQGTELKGAVQTLMTALNVKIITSRPYHPESLGKVWSACLCNILLAGQVLSRSNEVIAHGNRNYSMTFVKKE